MRRLLLVGAGHAHLEILRRIIERPEPRLSLAVVSLEEGHVYSGMTPGYLAGTYSLEEISFDVAALTRRAGGTLHLGRALEIDTARRQVVLDGGENVAYDLASFNVGSLTVGTATPGVEEHAALVKPFGRVRDLRRRVVDLAAGQGPASAVVVGAGAAGMEVACAIDAVLRAYRRRPQVALVEADRALSGYSPRFRRRALRVLERRGIALHVGARAESVEADRVVLEGGLEIPSRLTVWLTGPAAPPLFRRSKLTTDERGFLLVDRSLRSVGDPSLFAVGDCATLADFPGTPKAGVYAVRQAPVLWQSLMATLDGTAPPAYEPQRGFLSLLNTADGRALLRWKALVSHSRWAWRLKDRIDSGFMKRYQRLAEGTPA